MADVDAQAAKNKTDNNGKTETKGKAEARRAAVKANADKLAKKTAAKPTGFFKSVSIELKKVHWPDKEKVVKYTGVVFGVVVVLGTVIWVLDTAFSGVLSLIVG